MSPMSNSEARKREQSKNERWAHPDPTVRALIADAAATARVATLEDCATQLRDAIDGRGPRTLNERDSGYISGWDAAAAYFAAALTSAAHEIRDAAVHEVPC